MQIIMGGIISVMNLNLVILHSLEYRKYRNFMQFSKSNSMGEMSELTRNNTKSTFIQCIICHNIA